MIKYTTKDVYATAINILSLARQVEKNHVNAELGLSTEKFKQDVLNYVQLLLAMDWDSYVYECERDSARDDLEEFIRAFGALENYTDEQYNKLVSMAKEFREVNK